jgi:hypothetical protein
MGSPEDHKEQTSTTFFFPLRTNVHYFVSPDQQLALRERVKHASLLYDNLLFEGGIYDAIVWMDRDQGSAPLTDRWIPPHVITKEVLEGYRNPTCGDRYVLSGERGFATGQVHISQHAEFHSLLSELDAEHISWIETAVFDLNGEPEYLARDLAADDETALGDMLADKPFLLKKKILQNLNLDLILTSQLDVAASMDLIFEPLLSRKARRHSGLQSAPGFAAFQVAVPNLSHLSWNEILDIRDQECIKEFRQKMMEVEALARSISSQGDVKDLQLSISQIVTLELLREMRELIPKGIQVSADVICDVLLGFIPGASTVMAGLTGLGKLEAFNSSWIAAFLKLSKPSRS